MTMGATSQPALDGFLTYDAVIATRNRPAALALSIPLLLTQSRPPRQLIVIDSSDDHAPVAEVVAETTRDWPGKVIVEHTDRGSPYQRNVGLAYVTADVVLFPDDDSLLYPDAALAIMKAYERDLTGSISAVCAAEARVPPDGVDLGQDYDMTATHRLEARTRGWRNRLEKRFSHLKPTLYLGQIFVDRKAHPDWLAEANCVPVEYMTGFRMSFRTAEIRKAGFDNTLRDYGLDEDIDASFSVARAGLVIGARDAQIYHHRFPGGRGDGRKLGAVAVLNRAYVVLKHIHAGGLEAGEARKARARLRAFVRLKLLTGLLGCRSALGRARLAGAFAASRHVPALMQASPDALAETYRTALDQVGI